MFKNYLKIAWRTLCKDKEYSLLNILGLAIGITCSLFLILYVLDELSYDRYNENAERIYRVSTFIQEPEREMKTANTQYPLGPVLQKDFPEVEQAVRIVLGDELYYKVGEKQFSEGKIYYADKNLFDVFTFPFKEGVSSTALVEPNSIVLTESMAKKYFGSSSVVGRSFKNSRDELFEITGVIADMPGNSHFKAEAFISSSTLPKDFGDNWGQFGNFYTYVLLKPNSNAKDLVAKMLPLYDAHMAEIFEQYNVKIKYGLIPVTSIHLKSDLDNEPEETGSMSYIYIFSIVALFMLIIASINYMNLTTARAAGRAKEIGIRKVVGSSRSQLIKQFLLESVLVTAIATILSVLIVILLLPYFNTLSGKAITLESLFESNILYILAGVVVLVGLLGGSYPAIYLTSTNAIAVLKGKLAKASSNSMLRKALVTTQFTISMVMLICTMVVYNQLNFMRDKDLGFNSEQIISIEIDPMQNTDGKLGNYKSEILKRPDIATASISEATPGKSINFNLFRVQTENGFIEKGVDVYGIDEDYFNTLGIKVIEGRNFSADIPADTLNNLIVNETMVKAMGWDNALGKKITNPGGDFELEVIGVVKDFNQKSLYNAIEPLLLVYRPNASGLQAKITGGNISRTVSELEGAWQKIFPDTPFQYNFLDQDFNSQYSADQKRGQIFTAFSALTILISCLGLLSLVAFTTQQRRKEISIRKVVGAKVSNIVFLIARSFMALIGISCLMAFPIAYLFMDKWLEVFPYKTDLRVSTFLLSALVLIAITLITVSFHAIKAALTNPVKSLRAE
ncbi:ABC transporter permease [Pricia sp.]|uniref:ABC transporter permease n=1 Tax=Pricia sp. TaxID=2268138 RepID=UPI0035946C61